MGMPWVSYNISKRQQKAKNNTWACVCNFKHMILNLIEKYSEEKAAICDGFCNFVNIIKMKNIHAMTKTSPKFYINKSIYFN